MTLSFESIEPNLDTLAPPRNRWVRRCTRGGEKITHHDDEQKCNDKDDGRVQLAFEPRGPVNTIGKHHGREQDGVDHIGDGFGEHVRAHVVHPFGAFAQ